MGGRRCAAAARRHCTIFSAHCPAAVFTALQITRVQGRGARQALASRGSWRRRLQAVGLRVSQQHNACALHNQSL